jgi:hypothetical protein
VRTVLIAVALWAVGCSALWALFRRNARLTRKDRDRPYSGLGCAVLIVLVIAIPLAAAVLAEWLGGAR